MNLMKIQCTKCGRKDWSPAHPVHFEGTDDYERYKEEKGEYPEGFYCTECEKRLNRDDIA